jgi:Undecaprenyl-phosphate glucose phosphotransferase
VAAVWLVALSALTMVAFLGKVSGLYSRGWVVTWALLAPVQMIATRAVWAGLIGRWQRQGRLSRSVAIVGAGALGERVLSKLKRDGHNEVRIAGVFDDRSTRVPAFVAGLPVVGTTDDLVIYARRFPLDEIVVALPLDSPERIEATIRKLRSLPLDLRVSLDPLTAAIPMRGLSWTGSVPMVNVTDRPLKHWNAVAKWLEDMLLGGAAILILLPLMALIAVVVKLDSKGPVLFRQERFGFNNRPFQILKFRTMRIDAGDPTGAQRTVRGDARVTRIGHILRALSLDELPQLFNVIRGDMSLIGPRPHATAMKAGDRLYYEAVHDYFDRHRVKPGMTGWAQVNGLRGEIDTLEKARARVAYDAEYIDNWSLWLDIKIVFRTVRVLLTRDNAY